MKLASAWRKYERGIAHARTLCSEARTFENSNAYVRSMERNLRTPQEVEYVVSAREVSKPPDHWPLLAGEVIYNLRSALDAAIYALIAKNRGQSQYPIFTDFCEFQVKSKPMVKGVPEATRALIEAQQPYHGDKRWAALEPLAILNSFSNRDKHRELSTVACLHDLSYVGTADHVRLEWTSLISHNLPLEDNTEITRFIAFSKTDAEVGEGDVDPQFTYQVGIQGQPLKNTFQAIAKRVFQCLVEMETGQPISPWQQGYPFFD